MGILTDRLLDPIFSGMTIRELFSKISNLIQAAWESFLDIPLEKAIPLIIKGAGILVVVWVLILVWAVLNSLPDKPARAKKGEKELNEKK